MQTKTLEIRDEGTFISVLAIRMLPDNPTAGYYFNREGYPRDGSSITLMLLSDQKATNDLYGWIDLKMGQRTMPTAHNYIINHFNELKDGDVVDVQYILQETAEPKSTERISLPRV